jgi:hypothetical protein
MDVDEVFIVSALLMEDDESEIIEDDKEKQECGLRTST